MLIPAKQRYYFTMEQTNHRNKIISEIQAWTSCKNDVTQAYKKTDQCVEAETSPIKLAQLEIFVPPHENRKRKFSAATLRRRFHVSILRKCLLNFLFRIAFIRLSTLIPWLIHWRCTLIIIAVVGLWRTRRLLTSTNWSITFWVYEGSCMMRNPDRPIVIFCMHAWDCR